MAKIKILLATILLFTICFIPNTSVKHAFAASEDEVVTKGVYIDSIHIGGMTVKEAKQAVDDYVSNLQSKTITVNIDGNNETITLGELNYQYSKNNYIEEALEIGKHGNLIKRYKELKDIEDSNLVYKLDFTIDDEKLAEYIDAKCSQYDIPAVNATVSRVGGQFKYTDESIGRKLDKEATTASIKEAISDSWNKEDVVITATVVDDQPLYTRELVERCKDKLATFSTTYTNSSADRAGNLANGARLINNTVLYPGDIFSAYEKLTPFTTANGYFEAGSYANGKVVDSIGGGACQVTTTLYNAVLLAELEVVERAAHSMTISYADLGRDAAIAGTWKDLKFKNNKEVPIIVEVFTSGRTITFNIWGEETRDTANRTIKFETVILSEKEPGPDVITEDPTKPVSYRVTTQSPHTGYTAELYKIVYENGVEVSRTRVNKSTYMASPRYVTVGTMVEEEPEIIDENLVPETNPTDENLVPEKNPEDDKKDNPKDKPEDNMPVEEIPGDISDFDNQEDTDISEDI